MQNFRSSVKVHVERTIMFLFILPRGVENAKTSTRKFIGKVPTDI